MNSAVPHRDIVVAIEAEVHSSRFEVLAVQIRLFRHENLVKTIEPAKLNTTRDQRKIFAAKLIRFRIFHHRRMNSSVIAGMRILHIRA